MPGERAQVEATLARVTALMRDARTIVVRGRVAFLTPANVAERRSAAALVAALSTAGDELPERFHARHPGIDWTALKTNGNFAAQGDLKTHQAVLWRVLELEFPRIARQLGIRVDAAPLARRRPLWKRS